MSKEQLLKTLRAERQRWERLLAAVSEENMTQPGVAGHRSAKDVIAHVTAYKRWLVEWLQAALRHQFPAPSVAG
ncbi:MAG TPA: DinB family protein [Anaerolineae bacterium]